MSSSLENQSAGAVQKSSGFYYGWIIVLLGWLIGVVCYGFFYSFGVFFKDLLMAFHGNRASIALIASIMGAVSTGTTIIWGTISDKYGPRICMVIGGVLFCGGIIATTFATSLMQVYILMGVVAALGVATYTINVMNIGRWFMKKQGLAQGLIATGIAFGMIIMVPIASKVLATSGWQSGFRVFAIAGAVIFALSAIFMRKSPQDKGLLPYGATAQGVKAMQEVYAKMAASSKTVGQAVKTKEIWLLTLLQFLGLLPVYMLSAHLVNFAKDTGMIATTAALLMSAIGIGSILGKVGGGTLIDKIGFKKVTIACAIIEVCMFLWLSAQPALWMFWVITAVHGIGYGGLFVGTPVIMREHYGVAHYGKLMGITAIGTLSGGIAGPLIAGSIFESTGSYSTAFIVAAVSAACCGIVAAFVNRPKEMKETQGQPAKAT